MNVVVLGDGLLGSEIIKQSNWWCISRSKDGFDIHNIGDYLPPNIDVIVNCIAFTDTYSDDKDSNWNVNCVYVDKLIDYCNDNDIKLVHISTDYVYCNSRAVAGEDDVPVHCENWYGYTKLLSDGLVQLRSKNFLLIRCSHKPYPFQYDGAWIDYIGNFDYVDVIADLIIKSIVKGLSGLYNLGTEVKSMYEMASETSNPLKTITPSHIPNNVSMDISKIKKDLSI